jgi:alpha-beta hydrolase superfamily lysophospholipase
VIPRLSEAGLRVVTWDLRGHGRSEGRRGDIREYDVLVEDMLEIWSLANAGPRPVFLYGHSLGGQITLNFAVKHQPKAAGLVITSPWLRLAFVPPRWKTSLARVATRIWPSFTQNTDVVPARLSRDAEFLLSMPDPELMHHRMSARMFEALIAGAQQAFREGMQLPYPILLLHGSKDPVTSAAATKHFYEALRSEDKSLVLVPDALHETHNDICREWVIRQITGWLEARMGAATKEITGGGPGGPGGIQ